MNKREVIVFGKKYKNRREVARLFNINYYVLNTRILGGMSLEDAVNMGDSIYAITAFGKEHKSLEALSEYYGFDSSILSHRLEKEKNLEKAILNLLNTEKISFNGKEYNTLVNISREYGMEPSIISQRLKRGWSLKDSVFKPVAAAKSPLNTYFFRGVTYYSQRELADEYGLNVSIVSNLKNKLKIEFIESISLLVTFLERYEGRKTAKISTIPYIIYDGIWFDTLKDFCLAIGLNGKEFKNFFRNNNVSNHYEAFSLMRTTKRYRWIENKTGEMVNCRDLSLEHHVNVTDLERLNIARRELVRSYPNCTFNPKLTFEMPQNEFDIMIKEYKEIFNTGR